MSAARGRQSSVYDYLIVGAGLFGAVFAREAADRGRRCLVVDRRRHIAGNAYTELLDGIAVHRYGAHIFHTSDVRIWEYVQRFGSWCQCRSKTDPPGRRVLTHCRSALTHPCHCEGEACLGGFAPSWRAQGLTIGRGMYIRDVYLPTIHAMANFPRFAPPEPPEWRAYYAAIRQWFETGSGPSL